MCRPPKTRSEQQGRARGRDTDLWRYDDLSRGIILQCMECSATVQVLARPAVDKCGSPTELCSALV